MPVQRIRHVRPGIRGGRSCDVASRASNDRREDDMIEKGAPHMEKSDLTPSEIVAEINVLMKELGDELARIENTMSPEDWIMEKAFFRGVKEAVGRASEIVLERSGEIGEVAANLLASRIEDIEQDIRHHDPLDAPPKSEPI